MLIQDLIKQLQSLLDSGETEIAIDSWQKSTVIKEYFRHTGISDKITIDKDQTTLYNRVIATKEEV
jgi:hypothetical protein